MRNQRILAQDHPRRQWEGKPLTESIFPPSALLGCMTSVLVQVEHSNMMMVSNKAQVIEVSHWAPYSGVWGEKEATSICHPLLSYSSVPGLSPQTGIPGVHTQDHSPSVRRFPIVSPLPLSLPGGAGGLSPADSPALPNSAESDALFLHPPPGVSGFRAAQTWHPLLQLRRGGGEQSPPCWCETENKICS